MAFSWSQLIDYLQSRYLKRENGASAIEFAIVLPILVMLIFGMIEFSVAFYDKSVITNAGREGARAGIRYRFDVASSEANYLSNSEIQNVVNAYCQNYLITFGTPTSVSTTVAREGTGSSGDDLTVTVTYRYDYLVLPNFVTALAGPIDLTAVTVMRLE